MRKKKHAIENNGVYSYLTIQAYVDSNTDAILSLAIAKTVDIIKMIDIEYSYIQHTGLFQPVYSEFHVVK